MRVHDARRLPSDRSA